MSSGTVSIPAPSAIYVEGQRFGWWVYGLLVLMLALSCYFLKLRLDGDAGSGTYWHSFGTIVGFALPAVLVTFVLRMTTEVYPGQIAVAFGWIPTYRRVISIGAIDRMAVVIYDPIRDAKGWGIRTGKDGERFFSARGNRGVRLWLVDGGKILIGSQRPEDLLAAIEAQRHLTGS